ncbi:MAG: MmcQ/YjbR family DNA-binding protein [Muribaculum sp.]
MNIEEFREYCLSLGDVTEKTPFGKFARRFDSILVFYVLGHMFCLIDMDYFNSVNVKSTPEEIDELKLTYSSVSKPVNLSERYWIQLDFNGDIPDDKIRELVKRSFDIVKEKYRDSSKTRLKC